MSGGHWGGVKRQINVMRKDTFLYRVENLDLADYRWVKKKQSHTQCVQTGQDERKHVDANKYTEMETEIRPRRTLSVRGKKRNSADRLQLPSLHRGCHDKKAVQSWGGYSVITIVKEMNTASASRCESVMKVTGSHSWTVVTLISSLLARVFDWLLPLYLTWSQWKPMGNVAPYQGFSIICYVPPPPEKRKCFYLLLFV